MINCSRSEVCQCVFYKYAHGFPFSIVFQNVTQLQLGLYEVYRSQMEQFDKFLQQELEHNHFYVINIDNTVPIGR